VCPVSPELLPTDAVRKGTEINLVQDITFKPDVIEFQREVFYSPSLGKRFIGALPKGYEGEFGPGLKSLVLTLYHEAQVSQPNILKLLTSCGISISAATISRMLIDQAAQFHQEKKAIIDAGLQSTSYQHIDDTGARVNGKNHYAHVLCNPFYSAYFTRRHKDRLTILKILCQDDMHYEFSDESYTLMQTMGLSGKQLKRLKSKKPAKNISQQKLDEMLLLLFPNQKKQHKNRLVIQEAAALTAYRKRADAIQILICDDAPQFKKITEKIGLCWVHEGRHYKKLKPIFKAHRDALESFLHRFWALYHALLDYKLKPNPVQAQALSKSFDELMTKTGYDVLDQRIQMTSVRKDELLLVLVHPEIELHNNPAELAARAQARKRDVSLQTKNAAGTQAKDTMMTIVQTARKLGVSILDYINDRVSRTNAMTSLAEMIKNHTAQTQPIDEQLAA